MKWPEQLCPNCRVPLPRRKAYCLSCHLLLKDRAIQESAALAQAKQERALRQTKTFLSEFDKRAFELVIAKLKSLEKVTVSDLIDVLLVEGFFDKYQQGYKVGGVIYSLPKDLSQLKFVLWARKRVLGLAKWWATNEVAFIGAKVVQGHPYLFYLGKNPAAVFDPSMPKKSIAQRSVNRVSTTLEHLHQAHQEGEVSA